MLTHHPYFSFQKKYDFQCNKIKLRLGMWMRHDEELKQQTRFVTCPSAMCFARLVSFSPRMAMTTLTSRSWRRCYGTCTRRTTRCVLRTESGVDVVVPTFQSGETNTNALVALQTACYDIADRSMALSIYSIWCNMCGSKIPGVWDQKFSAWLMSCVSF